MAVADAIRESMSAVIDDEGSEMDLARVLKAVAEDPEARAFWQRLQRSRSALQTGFSGSGVDVSAAVQETIACQPSPRRRAGPFASLAAAASVTVAVVFGGQQLTGSDAVGPVTQLPGGIVPVSGAAPVQARFGAAPTAAGGSPSRQLGVATGPSVTQVYEQLARDRFERFGAEHAEATSGLQPNRFVPFARLSRRID